MEKKALLIYSPEDIEKNRWFIERLTGLFSGRGVELCLKTPEDCTECTDVSFVINRSRESSVSRHFEDLGIRSFNNSETVRVGNDKLEEYEFFKALELPVMETVGGDTDVPDIPFSFPIIVKSRSGHGGSGVFKAECPEDIDGILEGKDRKEYIFQEMCDEPGKDMRLYILGGRILAAVLRTSEDDFRSNFSLGGKASLTDPGKEAVTYANALCERLSPDYCGIDLIRHKGAWIVNEIEDAVGARMLYNLDVCDPAEEYMCYICEKTFQNQ